MPDFADQWRSAWANYVTYSGNQPANHPSRQMVTQVNGLGLQAQLDSLNYLYQNVDAFLVEAHTANQHRPPNPALESQLDIRTKQLSQRNAIEPYDRAGRSALQSLAGVTRFAQTRMGQKKPDSSEVMLLSIVVKDAKAISVALERDMMEYVTKTPETLARLRRSA